MNMFCFSNSFSFHTIRFDSFHYTDNRAGSPMNYFAYMISGSCRIVTADKTVCVKEGEFFFIPYQESYESFWYGKPEICFISLGFLHFPNPENKNYPVQIIPCRSKTLNSFYLLADVTQPSSADIGLFYFLASMLFPSMQHKSISRSQEIVRRSTDYLIAHPHAKADALAKNCNISEAALYAAFQKSSDLTVSQLRTHLLLEKAKELLISTDASIEQISDSLKFSSSSYFRKKFKIHFKMTPRVLRKKYRI